MHHTNERNGMHFGIDALRHTFTGGGGAAFGMACAFMSSKTERTKTNNSEVA